MKGMTSESWGQAVTNLGIYQYVLGNEMFNLRRLQAKIKVSEDSINDLLFADDCPECH